MAPTDAASEINAPRRSFVRRARRVLSPTRLIFLAHRWMGIALGVLVAAWCLSGIVMAYVGYPELTEDGRRAGLAPIDWAECCETPTWLALGGDQVRALAIETTAGRPVMTWRDGAGALHRTDLSNGEAAASIDEAAARLIASDYAAARGLEGAPARVESVAYDQWTMLPEVRNQGPFFKVFLDDPARTEIHVAQGSGAIAQVTTGRERFWSWPGAVTHWLYFTQLRIRSQTWYWFVVWTSLISCFLVGAGLYTGIKQFGKGKRRFSPYRGYSYVHHVSGMVFGILAFTWIASGFISMNPWGLLEGTGAADETAALSGGPAPSEDAVALLRALDAGGLPGDVVQIETLRFLGQTGALAHRADGSSVRLDPHTLAPAPIDQADLARAAALMRPDASLTSAEMIDRADAYYFGHKEKITLPVFRAITDDPSATRYYLDPTSGGLLAKIDRDAKIYRWLHYGLHRWDFFAGLRLRPVWDIVVIPLLLGLCVLSVTGAWMGLRRLGRKAARLF